MLNNVEKSKNYRYLCDRCSANKITELYSKMNNDVGNMDREKLESKGQHNENKTIDKDVILRRNKNPKRNLVKQKSLTKKDEIHIHLPCLKTDQ